MSLLTRRALRTLRCPRPVPVGVRSQMALMIARRTLGIGYRLSRQVRLKQTHRTLDVDTDRTRVDVCRRCHDTSDWSTITQMTIGIQNYVSDSRRTARVNCLLQADFVKGFADLVRTNHGYRR